MSFFRCFGSLPLTCACPFSVLCPVLCLSVLCSLVPFSGSSLRPLARSLPVRSLVSFSGVSFVSGVCLSVLWRSLVPSGSLVPFFGSSLRPLARSLPVRSLPGSLRFVLCVRSLRSLVPLSVLCAFSGVCLSVLWCPFSGACVLWCPFSGAVSVLTAVETGGAGTVSRRSKTAAHNRAVLCEDRS